MRRQAEQPTVPTPKWRGQGFQILRKGSGTCSEAPEVTRLAPSRMSAILHPGPVFPSPALLDSFQLHPSGKQGLDFGPRSWAINTNPYTHLFSLPPTWPRPALPLSDSCLCPSARPGSGWRGAGSPHETEPHSRHPSRLRRGVLSHRGWRGLWVGGCIHSRRKRGCWTKYADPLPLSHAKHMFGQFQGPRWGRLGAESGQAGVPRPRKGLGTRPRDCPLRRVRAQMVGGAGRDFQEYSSLLVNSPRPPANPFPSLRK